MSNPKTELDHRTEERWTVVRPNGTSYVAGRTREEAIADSQEYEGVFPAALRRTITYTVTITDTYPDEPYDGPQE